MPVVHITKKADKALRNLPQRSAVPLVSAITALRDKPFPPGYQKLQGIEHSYRIRVGDYRILYTFDTAEKAVTIYCIAHRKEVYKP